MSRGRGCLCSYLVRTRMGHEPGSVPAGSEPALLQAVKYGDIFRTMHRVNQFHILCKCRLSQTDLGCRAIQVVGAVLLSAAFLKAIEPFAFHQWVSDTTGWPISLVWLFVFGVVLYETFVGVMGILFPKESIPYIAATYGAFALLHAAMILWPEMGRCPCLGSLGSGVNATLQNTGVGLFALVVTIVMIGLSRGRMEQETTDQKKELA